MTDKDELAEGKKAVLRMMDRAEMRCGFWNVAGRDPKAWAAVDDALARCVYPEIDKLRAELARQQARVEEAEIKCALYAKAVEDMKRICAAPNAIDAAMEYGAKAERMKWEHALEACRKSISPRTEAENG